eukprot:IDg12013t1
MELILSHREFKHIVDKNLCSRMLEDPEDLSKWLSKDNFALMTIGLSLSNEMLNNVQHTFSALEMGTEISNVRRSH